MLCVMALWDPTSNRAKVKSQDQLISILKEKNCGAIELAQRVLPRR